MSRRSQEKRRAKAREKKRAHRRMLGSSPLSRLAGLPEEACECWMDFWDGDRKISLHVLRPVRGGQTVGVFFLIDRDCIGLQDALYRLDMEPSAFRESLREHSRADGTRILRVELAEVRGIVAGAIRWTRAHPFRLPPDTERCLKIIGGVGAIDTADIRDFGDEDGGLYYLGREEDLVRCLRDITLEEFMGRDDVTCDFLEDEGTFHDGEEYDADAEDREYREEGAYEEDGSPMEASEPLDGEAMEQILGELRERVKHNILNAARRWCFSQAVAPHPELANVVDLFVEASLEGLGADNAAASARRAQNALEVLRSFEDPSQDEALAAAAAQWKAFMQSFSSEKEFAEVTGFPDLKA
jgi:hypothetical protein